MKAKELAKLLGVSPATISLLVNDKPGLSQKTRKKLTEQIIELGYGSMLGQGKAAEETKAVEEVSPVRPSIAYISYKQKDPWEDIYSFYVGVLEGAQQEAREIDCNLVVIYRESESNLKRALKRAGEVIGAIIVCDDVTQEILQELDGLNIPCVFIDVFDPNLPVNSVNVDNRQSMYRIVDYLKNMGHREIGYVVSGWFSDSNEDRRIAFRRAIRDLHLRERQEFFFSAGNEKGPMDTSVLEALFTNLENMPTALCTENDSEALRTVNALKRCGFRVPEDVSVVGFDDNPLSRICEPRLTTVRSSRHRMGRECVAMILRLKRLRESDTVQMPMKISISTDIVERDSVARIER